MKLMKCEKGHFYDGEKYPDCPYCNTDLQKQGGAAIVNASQPDAAAPAALAAQPDGPVAGWLVVKAGPGRGSDLRLAVGRTALGLDASGAPVTLSADAPLSARVANLVYDPADGKFTLLPGTAQELCYIGVKSVLLPEQLTGGEEVTIGKSTLKFVPFCGQFNW